MTATQRLCTRTESASTFPRLVLSLVLLSAAVIRVDRAAAFVVAPRSLAHSATNAFSPIGPVGRRRPPFSPLGASDGEGGADPDADSPASDGDDGNVLSRINSFLDTPILDANDRTDQGALAEALKRFVRKDPQVASVTFSAVVLLSLTGLVRLLNFFTYGV
eukprot:CAMPEP_0183307824 /NCGR_PEP_ID=MMETSP0160_2-20130417/19567_1 /TAXON_ID=2839 ORGANISM="Odontella Sinensis, Strain Grunow 1884" /NCGR_SAMPLE_ID=MMETSP0160_2 /ASSEMBLY_ACC=CAM_ASM_000250 /LENGTH=161 /DNA_ID=CAMNT_0025471505 /DNA_START=87 /DNA_END=572 /DNA_ORIENTATION=+